MILCFFRITLCKSIETFLVYTKCSLHLQRVFAEIDNTFLILKDRRNCSIPVLSQGIDAIIRIPVYDSERL